MHGFPVSLLAARHHYEQVGKCMNIISFLLLLFLLLLQLKIYPYTFVIQDAFLRKYTLCLS
jgi:hypothetical protein